MTRATHISPAARALLQAQGKPVVGLGTCTVGDAHGPASAAPGAPVRDQAAPPPQPHGGDVLAHQVSLEQWNQSNARHFAGHASAPAAPGTP